MSARALPQARLFPETAELDAGLGSVRGGPAAGGSSGSPCAEDPASESQDWGAEIGDAEVLPHTSDLIPARPWLGFLRDAPGPGGLCPGPRPLLSGLYQLALHAAT